MARQRTLYELRSQGGPSRGAATLVEKEVKAPTPRGRVGKRVREEEAGWQGEHPLESSAKAVKVEDGKGAADAKQEQSQHGDDHSVDHGEEDKKIPRLPSDFVPVTSPKFVASTSTPIENCFYQRSFISREQSSEWYDSLLALPHWYRPTLKMYGREIVQSREIAAYSKMPDLKLKYSGQEVQMHPWPEVLKQMEDRVRECVGRDVKFNHAMLNFYEDGSVHIGRHSDNLENRVIVTVSLGADRTWIMTRRPPRGAKASAKKGSPKLPPAESHRWAIEDGSLLVMQGDCQKEWYHEIPKEKKITTGRISITFRQLVYD